jgi:predicted RNase H-like nuclease (RuvC/YqgF family)
MEWLKQLLEQHGVSGEVVQNAVAAAEEKLKDFVPKHRFDEVNEAKKQLAEQLQERDNQLSQLKKAAGDNEELRKQIEALQNENKEREKEYQGRLRDMAITTAIKLAVAGEAHDPDLVASLIDKSKVEVDEQGNIKAGLEDQIKSLRESKAFLFVQKQADPQGKLKGMNPADGREPSKGGIKNPWSKEYFNLTEQGRILRENPELAEQLKAQAGG